MSKYNLFKVDYSKPETVLIKETRVYKIFRLAEKKKKEIDNSLLISDVKECLSKLEQLRSSYRIASDINKREIRSVAKKLRRKYLELCSSKDKEQSYLFVHRKTGQKVKVGNVGKISKEYLDENVRQFRRGRKLNYSDFIKYNKIPFYGILERVGLVYQEPGLFASAFIRKKIGQLESPKKPQDRLSNYIGIEFEFTSKATHNELGLKLFRAGLADFCELKTDGSLRPKDDEYGYEIAALFKESNYHKYLKKLCEVLDEVKAEVEDRRCGLHVHIDVRRRKRDVVYHNLVSCQNLMFKMMPTSRRDGEFCMRVTSKKFPTKFTGTRQERYRSINAAAFYRHGTLEVRMHEGTVNFLEVRNWVSLLVKIANYKSKLTRSISNINGLQKALNLNEVLVGHVRDRINKWNILFPQTRRQEQRRLAIDLPVFFEDQQPQAATVTVADEN